MKLAKAIEIQTILANAPDWVFDNENRDALKLGIEAMKRCRSNYLNPQRADFRLLPGETEEE